MKKLVAHREQPLPSLRDRRDDVPDELEAILPKMVAKRPEDRYASMREVIKALQACLAIVVDLQRHVTREPASAGKASSSRASMPEA